MCTHSNKRVLFIRASLAIYNVTHVTVHGPELAGTLTISHLGVCKYVDPAIVDDMIASVGGGASMYADHASISTTQYTMI